MRDEDKTNEQLIKELAALRLQNNKMLDMAENREKHYLSIAQSARNAIISADINRTITFFNGAAENYFGYSAEEVVGRPLTTIMPERFHKEHLYGLRRLSETGKANMIGKTVELAGLKKDGGEFPVEMYISMWKAGEHTFFTGNIRDITERKRAEEELQERSLFQQRLIDTIPNPIYYKDTNGLYQGCNKAFEEYTGLTINQIVGKSTFDIFPKDLADEYNEKDKALFHEKGVQVYESTVVYQDGTRRNVIFNKAVYLNINDVVAGLVGVIVDITEQVQMSREKQRLLQQAARAQRLASLSTISAGIAHEINQPLNTLKVIVDGMLYWHKRGRLLDQEKIVENLRKISTQADRVDEIIKHMRSLVGSDKTTGLEACNLNSAVSGALSILGRQLTSHKITVKKALARDLPRVLGNTNRLEEVVINLLVNGMQALDKVDSGEKEITCSTRRAGEKVVLEISDNATGVSEEIKDLIFDPFYTTKDTGVGMGLGLSIVQNVLSSFSGQIEVFNNSAGGATFRVELPAIENRAL